MIKEWDIRKQIIWTEQFELLVHDVWPWQQMVQKIMNIFSFKH